MSFHGCGMGLCAEAPGLKAAVSTTELYRNEEREIKVHEFFIVGYTPVAVCVCVGGCGLIGGCSSASEGREWCLGIGEVWTVAFDQKYV